MTHHDARLRIQIEFIEMPGLKLSRGQVQRLCGVPRELCDDALATLVQSGFLRQKEDGTFMRGGLGDYVDTVLGPAPLAAAAYRAI